MTVEPVVAAQPPPPVGDDTVVRRSPATAAVPTGGDGALLVAHLDTSEVFRLDRSGALIWLAVDGLRTVSAISTAVADDLGRPPAAEIRTSCAAFIGVLLERGLLECAR